MLLPNAKHGNAGTTTIPSAGHGWQCFISLLDERDTDPSCCKGVAPVCAEAVASASHHLRRHVLRRPTHCEGSARAQHAQHPHWILRALLAAFNSIHSKGRIQRILACLLRITFPHSKHSTVANSPAGQVACCASLSGRWLWSQARSVLAVAVQLARAAKVGELDVAGGIEQQVLRLQVAARSAHAGAVIYGASCVMSCLTPPLPCSV